MNYRSGGPRSFNTIKRSHREERARRRVLCAKTLAAIMVVFLLLTLTALILLVCNVAVDLQNRRGNAGGNEPEIPTLIYAPITLPTSSCLEGEMVVVNGNYAYAFHQNDADKLVPLSEYSRLVDGKNAYEIKTDKTQRLQRSAAESLNALLTAYYRKTGVSLVVYDTYRTTDEQTKISSSVAAGYSEHHTGLVFSLSLSKNSLNMEMSEYADFLEMCHLYGFIQRYPEGKSKLTGVSNYGECLRYVGVAHATYMAENGLCLEEYVDLLRKNHTSTKGTDGKHLAVDTNGDGTADYAVYYVPKNGSADLTTVYIPDGMSYTVSGDNMGGFIVTVTLNS